MGQDPSQSRDEIDDTRARMGETVEALGDKADVKSRAKESVADKVDSVRSKVTGAGSRVSDAAPDSGQMKQGARQAVGVAQENPLGLALGSVAVGFLAGMLVPSTRIEDERIGPVADRVDGVAHLTARLLYLLADLGWVLAHCTSSFTVSTVCSGTGGPASWTSFLPVSASTPAITP